MHLIAFTAEVPGGDPVAARTVISDRAFRFTVPVDSLFPACRARHQSGDCAPDISADAQPLQTVAKPVAKGIFSLDESGQGEGVVVLVGG